MSPARRGSVTAVSSNQSDTLGFTSMVGGNMQQILRRRAVTAAVAVALVAGAAAIASGQGLAGPGRHGRFGAGHGPGAFPLVRALDLTEAQREQVRSVMQRYEDQMSQAGKRLREAHDAQRAAIETVPVNEGLIRSTAQTLANAQTDMALLRARIHTDVWALLTPEQQEKATQLRAQRQTRLKERLEQRQQRRQQRQPQQRQQG
jgi:Spy/CpxP family protein refolding chaperone